MTPAGRMEVPSRAAAASVLIGGAILAVVLGLIAFTTSPILIALAAAAVVGPMLVFRLHLALWVLLVGGLLVAGVVPIWGEGQANRAVWALSALSFLIFLTLLFRMLVTESMRRETPGFVWALLAFIAFATLTTALQLHSAYELSSGFKRYFQAVSVTLAFTWLAFSDRQMRGFRVLVLVVALAQLPWAVYELLRLVPIREATRALYPGMIPIDAVAGTFGANLTKGGANAEMATFLLVVLAFMLSRWRRRVSGARRVLWLAPLVVGPLFLGETKVVVVLLPLLFVVLYRREIVARPLVAFGGLVLGAAITIAATFTYLGMTNRSLSEQVAHTLEYNVGDRGYGGLVLNRGSVIPHWLEHQSVRDPAPAIVGNGMGSAHDATGGHVARRWPGFGVGLTAASTLLWEVGLFGVALYALVFLFAWRTAGRVARASKLPWVRADAEAIQAALPVFAFYVFYRVALLEGFPFQLFFFGLLGYLAWLARRQRREEAEAR